MLNRELGLQDASSNNSTTESLPLVTDACCISLDTWYIKCIEKGQVCMVKQNLFRQFEPKLLVLSSHRCMSNSYEDDYNVRSLFPAYPSYQYITHQWK